MDFIISNFGKIAIGIIAGIALFFIVKNIAKIIKFLREVRVELTKVSWPTRKEVVGATMIILILTGILALYVGLADLGLSKLVSLFLR